MKDMTPFLIRVAVIATVCILFLAAFFTYMSSRGIEDEPEPVKKFAY
ncbi:MAG TPA: hypothetical protein P5160_07985 [Candidatus Omnitrophota bacterium]|jgi:hypothetical protein|nr:hypothetical protein [Candidatus Omnitrophota bacterium]